MHRSIFVKWLWIVLAVAPCGAAAAETRGYSADVCVYGGTASGMMAAVAASKAGKSVIVVEPSRWLGGIIGGGIRVRCDCKYPKDIGGLTKMMLEQDAKIGGGTHDRQNAFREFFVALAKKHKIKVIFAHRLGRSDKDAKTKRITMLHLDYAPPTRDGCPVSTPVTTAAAGVTAKIFIDASYEGDLMARAGVSFTVGRESKDKYAESLAGVRNVKVFDVDPYIKPGDRSSGLLPMISPEPIGEMGSASRYIIAYNFRFQWTAGGQAFGQPDNYDPLRYELLRRALKSARKSVSWPHGNYDRRGLLSGGIPGRQSDYPTAGWPERAKIWREWIDHVKIMHKLTGSTGTLKKGEYPDSDDFPNQLYIRMARRMLGRYVMTESDLRGKTKIQDSIGLGYYKVDIYPCRLVATDEGKVASEGEIFVMISPGPYRIPYRSLTPKAAECTNLLVPVCISASHVALSSIRMEPTYMVMGESAGIAAGKAIDESKSVQDIDPSAYRKALHAAGQVLEWDGTGYGSAGGSRRPASGGRFRFAQLVKECDANGDSLVSSSEWKKGKKGWEWLLPIIDTDKNGQIDAKEYAAFQIYKARNPDWAKKRPKAD